MQLTVSSYVQAAPRCLQKLPQQWITINTDGNIQQHNHHTLPHADQLLLHVSTYLKNMSLVSSTCFTKTGKWTVDADKFH